MPCSSKESGSQCEEKQKDRAQGHNGIENGVVDRQQQDGVNLSDKEEHHEVTLADGLFVKRE